MIAATRATIASTIGVRSIIYKTSLSSVSVSGAIFSFFFTLDPDSLDKLIEAAVFNLPEYIGMIEADGEPDKD